MTRTRKLFTGLAVTLALICLIIGITISPLVLNLLAKAKLNWPLLSNIGQSYGAASALLSAFAFLGVALTLLLQIRQNREARTYSIRQHHSALLQMAMADGRYLEVWGNFPAPMNVDRDVMIYTNLVMNYLSSLYVTGVSNLEEIRYYVKDIFDGAVGRAYWEYNREGWLKLAHRNADEKLAIAIDAEYQLAITNGPPGRPLLTAVEVRPKAYSEVHTSWIQAFKSRLRAATR
jgi:hypothetical protein